MRRSRMALIVAIGAIALSASILQAQMFGRRLGPAQDPAPTASESQSSTTPSRGVRQLLRNGLDYLDNYGDPERALPYLREAQARQQELNPTEQRQLDEALARTNQRLANLETDSPDARKRAPSSASDGVARASTEPQTMPSQLAPEASVYRAAAELPTTRQELEAAEPELPGDLDLTGAISSLETLPEASNVSDADDPLVLGSSAEAEEVSPPANASETPRPIGLTILSDPSDHLEAGETLSDSAELRPSNDEPKPAEDDSPANASLMEPPPALPAPDFEPAPLPADPETVEEVSEGNEAADSGPSPSVIQQGQSGVLLVPPPPQQLGAGSQEMSSTSDVLASPDAEPELPMTVAPANTAPMAEEEPIPDRLATSHSLDEADSEDLPSLPGMPNEVESPAFDASEIESPAFDASASEAPLPVPGDLPGIDLSQAIAGSTDPALAADPHSSPATVPDASTDLSPTASEPPSTPPSPSDANQPGSEDFPPLPVEASAIPPQGASEVDEAQSDGPSEPSIGGLDPSAFEDLPSSTSTLRPEILREVEEIARRQEEEDRMSPRSYEPAGPTFGGGVDELGGEGQIDLPSAPSPTEARPLKPIPVPEEFERLAPRNFAPNRKYFAAAATPHMPLYFQDAVLERYGQSVEQALGPIGRRFSYPLDDPRQSNQRMQLLQPAYSVGLFAAQIVALPYNVIMDPPWEAQYDLGYFRPGDPVPPDLYYLPWTGLGPPLKGNRYGKPRGPSVK